MDSLSGVHHFCLFLLILRYCGAMTRRCKVRMRSGLLLLCGASRGFGGCDLGDSTAPFGDLKLMSVWCKRGEVLFLAAAALCVPHRPAAVGRARRHEPQERRRVLEPPSRRGALRVRTRRAAAAAAAAS